jgi:hypothetical protein
VKKRLQTLEVEARRLTWYVNGSQVEVKPAGIAFHDREVGDDDLLRWRGLVEELLSKHDLSGLERLEGERVLELRPMGQNKGKVLHRLPRAPRGAFDASLVVVGDDRRDRDLFETLKNRGLSVLVADEDAPTRAVRRLSGHLEVARFLVLLADGRRSAWPPRPDPGRSEGTGSAQAGKPCRTTASIASTKRSSSATVVLSPGEMRSPLELRVSDGGGEDPVLGPEVRLQRGHVHALDLHGADGRGEPRIERGVQAYPVVREERFRPAVAQVMHPARTLAGPMAR